MTTKEIKKALYERALEAVVNNIPCTEDIPETAMFLKENGFSNDDARKLLQWYLTLCLDIAMVEVQREKTVNK